MILKRTLFLFFLFLIVFAGCNKNKDQQDKKSQEHLGSGISTESQNDEQSLRSCLGPNYPDAVFFKKEYLKLINPQTADYELSHSENLYDIEIDLDKDGFKERAVSGLISLKPEVESEGKYKGFVAILKKTANQCQTVFFQEMETGEINNMNLIVKGNLLMVAFAANTGYSIFIEYQNGKYKVVEENDETDEDTLPEELKNHS